MSDNIRYAIYTKPQYGSKKMKYLICQMVNGRLVPLNDQPAEETSAHDKLIKAREFAPSEQFFALAILNDELRSSE